MGQVTKANVEDVVGYHTPRPDQVPHYEAIRAGELAFIRVILEHSPECADQQAGIRLIRQGSQTINGAIALDGKI
jgi:hypothetical protein